jgi:hypothetical protein
MISRRLVLLIVFLVFFCLPAFDFIVLTLVNLHSCFSFPGFTVAHCDAGTTAGWNGTPELINDLNTKILNSIQQARTDYIQYPTKEYPSELKPLFSAFGLKNFTITTLRSFLLYYLPLIQPKPHTDTDDEDEDLLQDAPPEEKHVDLVTPFHNSVKQIMREVSSFIFLIYLYTLSMKLPAISSLASTDCLVCTSSSKHLILQVLCKHSIVKLFIRYPHS